MKFLISIAYLICASAASSINVKLFTSAGCGGTNLVSSTPTLSSGQCVAVTSPVTVSELGKNFQFMRLSDDTENEVLLFETNEQCTAYPVAFDPSQQVTFLHADKPNVCLPCYRCGNVQSLQIGPIKESQSSASAFLPSAILTTLLLGSAALLM